MSVDPSGEAMLPLDGNAAAGLLSELFAVDVTTAVLTCGGCGAAAALAEAKVYGGMGVVFRCAGCDSVVLRVVRTPAGIWVDMQGTRTLHVALPPR